MLMEMKRDDWFRAAMADETVVVELLLRLKHQYSHASSSQMKSKTPAMFLRWGIRQPRSRSSPINIRCHGVTVKREKRTVSGELSNTTTRFSPTTPLSWSGGAGSSSPLVTNTVDGGFEESSRPSSPPAASRSKGTITTAEITSDAKNKRLRRKKTFSELKEEESLLMKERVQLTERIATTRETVKEQGVRNDNLKRLKHDLALHSGFVLPDLNMMPSEDDSRVDTLYGTS